MIQENEGNVPDRIADALEVGQEVAPTAKSKAILSISAQVARLGGLIVGLLKKKK